MPRFKRMLLVEDDEKDIELTLEALDEYNLANEVDVARDGKEALDYLYFQGRFADRLRETPAVVLLDLKMPKVSGLDVLRQIKANENLKMIPVVVLSSSAEEQDVIESYKLGVNAYVVKPVDIQQFLEAIRKLGLFWALVNEPPPSRNFNTA
ncbi:MAG: response regulator [Acidobacteria bacterium]|nr:response regulator [Acidobacteriota bacterium]MCI0620614.1 response regulator [Acidobacteriota bacterium]MCI0722743.1 response regulator [Acidobacteriota bacterium]